MVIPGVSGSMMLMLMGYYYPVIGAIKNLINALVALDGGAILYNVGILLPFGIGVVIGIFAIAKLIEILLAKWNDVLTMVDEKLGKKKAVELPEDWAH